MTTAAVQAPVRFHKILFTTDFSTAAAHAVPYVHHIAKHYDADVVALHVRPPAVNALTQPPTWPSEEVIQRENEILRSDLRDLFGGLRTAAIVKEGDIQSNVESTIGENQIDLMILGTRGRTGLSKLLLGSIAEEIFRTVNCPVLTVGPHIDSSRGGSAGFREILFATDFTSESKAAAAYAVSLAQEFQARLVLMHIVPELKAGELVTAADITTAATDLLRKLVPEEALAWCKPEYIVERGNPADRILEVARLRESDLIVLGAKLETGVPGAATHLPIATAHKVVSHATCPVLTVRS